MARRFPELAPDSPQTVAELRARIAAGKAIALKRLSEHAADPAQPEVSRDVCAGLAERIRKPTSA